MAASSSSQNPDDVVAETYIGSYVSLTTKNDIRYEGFVFRVDAQTSSIFLGNVKMFGTEGRTTTNVLQVPPNNIIIDSIIFQSKDLKDVRVISPPEARNPTDLPDDPAIIHTCPPFPRFASFTSVHRPLLRSYSPFITRLPSVGTSYPQFLSDTLQQPIRQPSILTAPYPGSLTSHNRPLDISSFEPFYDSIQSSSSCRPLDALSFEPYYDSIRSSPNRRLRDISPSEPSSVQSRNEPISMALEAKKLPEQQSIKMVEATSSNYGNKRHNKRHGLRETRKNAVSQAVTSFAEEFDFEAMNRKFKKAEIWDHLSKNNKQGTVDKRKDEKKGDRNNDDKLTFGVENPSKDCVLRPHGQGRSSQGAYRGGGSKNAGKSYRRAAR